MPTRSFLAPALSAFVCLSLLAGAAAQTKQTQQAQHGGPHSSGHAQVVADFQARVKEYQTLREQIERKLPKLPKESTPEQIEQHKVVFQERVRSARAGARHGDVFTPAAAEHIRAVIKTALDAQEKQEVRQTVFEAETKGVPLRVNYAYPESRELVEMSPTLLMKLPQLPKQLRYRFVGRNLLLVDRENGLIVDYMTDALPGAGEPKPPTAAESGEAVGARVAAKATAPASALMLTLPNKEDSVRFVVIGDTGTGTPQQKQLADVMTTYRGAFPYEFVLMMGDNMYGGEKAADFRKKFEDIYKPLLDSKVTFYATLGNHDESNQRFYDHFNMKGEEYHRFKKGDVAFYCLNSNYMDKKQVSWLEGELAKDGSRWKVAFFHHPPYSSGGKHGSSTGLREIVEPIFVKYGVDVVFAGHEHFYERIKPQKGIHYFISGAGGKLRPGDVKENSPLTEKAYDADMSFMLIEVAGDEMHFQVVNRLGKTVDSGVIKSRRAAAKAASN